MQAQIQAQAQASSSAPQPDNTYHAPTPPKIPMNHVQSLIPRLTTTINDIDSFRILLAQGSQDGSMPDWDVTLQRYSVLLARITALSKYISQPPPIPAGTRTPLAPRKPALQTHLAHPLQPLPSPGPEVSPFAPDVYFQVLNTLPLPALSEAQHDLLTSPGWVSETDLRKMDDSELEGLEKRLKERLKRENGRARSLVDEIDRKAGEVEWTMRVNEDEEDDGSLFGGGSGSEEGGEEKEGQAGQAHEQKSNSMPNPREGWTIQDYVKYMESGTTPTSHSVPTTTTGS